MIMTGLDSFISTIDDYRGREIALVANHTSVTADLRYSWDAFRQKGIRLKRIFAPEHGLFGVEQDQAPVQHQHGPDCDVVSLYGNSIESLRPAEEDLRGCDLVLFDIQDIGARYYTYLNTMVFIMQALHGKDTKLLVLDRPNPLGGVRVEGPLLSKGYESFVGLLPVPVRHGLTAGETAVFAAEHLGLDLDMDVVCMQGWERDMSFEDTGLPWVPPSPNMPALSTAALYPGMCLFEGINVSEGRGTTTPFEMIGADFIDPEEYAAELQALDLPGVYFRPVMFKPVFNRYAGRAVGGVYIHITGRDELKPFQTGVAMVKVLFDLYEQARFLHDVYEFNSAHPAFDLLTGSSRIREMIIQGISLDEITGTWAADEDKFRETKGTFHLYR